MLKPRNFGVWVWWFHFPVRLEETHFATLVHQTGLQKDGCPWKWGSVRRHKLGFWGYIQAQRRAGIPLVLIVFWRWPQLLGDIFTLFEILTCVHNRVTHRWIWCSVASRYWSDMVSVGHVDYCTVNSVSFLAMSTFSPVGSLSSDGMCVCVCVCGRNELEVCTTLAYPHIQALAYMHPQTIWG